jgi:hypothetical protein
LSFQDLVSLANQAWHADAPGDFGGLAMSACCLHQPESFSVDAGWTEPCLRGAIDAVIHLCNNTRANFNGGFTPPS